MREKSTTLDLIKLALHFWAALIPLLLYAGILIIGISLVAEDFNVSLRVFVNIAATVQAVITLGGVALYVRMTSFRKNDPYRYKSIQYRSAEISKDLKPKLDQRISQLNGLANKIRQIDEAQYQLDYDTAPKNGEWKKLPLLQHRIVIISIEENDGQYFVQIKATHKWRIIPGDMESWTYLILEDLVDRLDLRSYLT